MVDQINAYDDLQRVGFLAIAYIPRKNWIKYFPDVFSFVMFQGKRFFPREYFGVPWKQIPLDVLRDTLISARLYIDGYMPHEEQSRVPYLSDEEIIKEWKDLEKRTNKKFKKQMQEYENYFVDKPYIDYIKVIPEYQRQGIGSALYKAGYEWMKSKGMKLHASGTQSQMAQAAWDKMEKAGYVEKTAATWNNKPVERKYLVQK